MKLNVQLISEGLSRNSTAGPSANLSRKNFDVSEHGKSTVSTSTTSVRYSSLPQLYNNVQLLLVYNNVQLLPSLLARHL
jgi:hypothetical protein